ncbi:ATPase PAAT isoform X2 [Phyllopteryx taeniolatus]|uniref:ATPase PAAT isoform X2 n=1 Tax=Phyllopteryx taeniolatus TaxID=161469 RepID=UPI002AD495F9|nr:ATPase PAAT isoform X2 [Phyllopteryx taeniolatus]
MPARTVILSVFVRRSAVTRRSPPSTLRDGGVLLERADGGGAAAEPCVLTLSCGPAAISRLTLVSEARTMEVYLPTGEYCATVRGDEQDHVRHGDRGPFYRKQLSLDGAPSSCDVKLLSLSGRSSVLLCGAVVGLRPPRPGPARDGGAVDLQRVRSLVDEMGAGLSPGAQNLMDEVRLQQKAAADSAPDAPAPDGRRLAEMMRHVLKGGGGRPGAAPPEMLREVCGQVTRLRLDREQDRDRTHLCLSRSSRRLTGDQFAVGLGHSAKSSALPPSCGISLPKIYIEGCGRVDGAPPGGDGAPSEGARGPPPGRSGAQAGESAARRPPAGGVHGPGAR